MYLTLWAEITGFADRRFYDDWWNSTSMDEYWRKWNLPVHQFLMRHIYWPIRRRKVGKVLSAWVVFLFSAFFHEYIWAGMIGKITMIGFNGIAV